MNFRNSRMPFIHDFVAFKIEALINPEGDAGIAWFVGEHPSIQFAYIVDMNGRKTTKNITNIADRAKYENYGVGTDQSDREWFIKPRQEGKVYVSDFFISKMTGILCFTVSAPIVNDQDEMIGIFGVDIQFEDWVKRAEDMEDMDHIALRAEYKEVKSKAKHGHHWWDSSFRSEANWNL